MKNLKRLPLAEHDVRKIPLGLRTIYYKEIPLDGRHAGVHRIDAYKSDEVPSFGGRKLISRI